MHTIKLFALIFLLLTALLIPTPSAHRHAFIPYSSSPAPQAVRDARDAIFNLQVDGETICTAFSAKTPFGTELISAGHCTTGLQPHEKVTALQWTANRTYEVKLKSHKLEWPHTDYSVWTFVGSQPTSGVITTNLIPSFGDPVWSIIGTKGLAPFLTSGVQAGIYQDTTLAKDERNGARIITIPAAGPGASGAPVFDSQGRVWGILVGGNAYIPGLVIVVRVP